MILGPKPITFDRLVRFVITILVFTVVIIALNYLSDVLLPFALAILLAYLTNPIVHWFERRVKKRGLAVVLSLLLIVVLITVVSLITIPIVINEVIHITNLITKFVNNTYQSSNAQNEIPIQLEKLYRELLTQDEIQKMLNFENIQNIAKEVFPRVLGVFENSLNFVSGLLGLVVVILYLVFILLDYDKILGSWQNLIPIAYRSFVTSVIEDFNIGMKKYFRAQALIALIIAILSAIGFTIIGLPMGFVFGLFVGMLNLIPYLQNIAFLPATLLVLIHSLEYNSNFWIMFGLTMLIFGIIQFLQDAVLVPKIMGDATGMNPAIILLSLSIWGKLLGFLGLLIALPVTSILISYYYRYILAQEHIELSQSPSTPDASNENMN